MILYCMLIPPSSGMIHTGGSVSKESQSLHPAPNQLDTGYATKTAHLQLASG
jgi:hypothetical protein